MDAKSKKILRITSAVIGAVLCLVFPPVFLFNIVTSIVGYAHPEEMPTIFGITELIENTGAMKGHGIYEGDLVFVKVGAEKGTIAAGESGDVVAVKTDGIYKLRRVDQIVTNEQGETSYLLKADEGKAEDEEVSHDEIIGVSVMKLHGMGKVILFSQTTIGIILFLGLPALLFVAYDILEKYLADKSSNREAAAAIKAYAESSEDEGTETYSKAYILGNKDTLTVVEKEDKVKVKTNVKSKKINKSKGMIFPAD